MDDELFTTAGITIDCLTGGPRKDDVGLWPSDRVA